MQWTFLPVQENSSYDIPLLLPVHLSLARQSGHFLQQPVSIISREYSSEWKKGDEPYYPVNNEKNNNLYQEYEKLAKAEKNVLFGGRLGQYKYYDMDKVISAALDMCSEEL